MIRSLTLTFIIIVLLAACTPATALPTENPTSTPLTTAIATLTPAPTQTPTPTLEPWMQSLPEGIDSVEMDGKDIFGLDAVGNKIMKFDIKSGEWKELVMTFDSMDEAADYYTAQFVNKSGATSWEELRDAKLVKDLSFNEHRNYQYPELPYSAAKEEGYVFEIIIAHFPFQETGKNYVMAVTAFEGTDKATFVLCGIDNNGEYQPICTYLQDSEMKLDSIASLRRELASGVHAFEFVYYMANPHQVEKYFDKIAETNGQGDNQSQYFYHQQIEMRGDNLEIFKRLLDDPDGPPWTMTRFGLDRKIPQSLFDEYPGVVVQYLYMFKETGMEKQFIVPSVILH